MRRHWYEVSKLCFALCCMAFFLNCSEVEIEHNEENVIYVNEVHWNSFAGKHAN